MQLPFENAFLPGAGLYPDQHLPFGFVFVFGFVFGFVRDLVSGLFTLGIYNNKNM
jgi:hypothetical protein